MKFEDRGDAGRRLADKLAYLKDAQPVILALPRGGVAVGFEIARELDARHVADPDWIRGEGSASQRDT